MDYPIAKAAQECKRPAIGIDYGAFSNLVGDSGIEPPTFAV